MPSPGKWLPVAGECRRLGVVANEERDISLGVGFEFSAVGRVG
jgi:hypothetical protein